MPVWDKQHEDEELVRGRYSAKSTRPWDTMLDESLAPKRYWLLEYTGIAISNDDETAAGYHPGRITNGANVFGVFLLVRARVFRLQFWVQLLALYGWAFFYKYVLADSNSTTGEVGRLDTVTNDTFDAVQGLAIFVLTLAVRHEHRGQRACSESRKSPGILRAQQPAGQEADTLHLAGRCTTTTSTSSRMCTTARSRSRRSCCR